MILNLEISQYLEGLTTGSGVRLLIHQRGTFPFPEHEGIYVPSGMESNVALKLVITLHKMNNILANGWEREVGERERGGKRERESEREVGEKERERWGGREVGRERGGEKERWGGENGGERERGGER